jgi:CRISPR-associated Csx2 family protein
MHTLFTFLGTGPKNGTGYTPVPYRIGDWSSTVTPFAQAAIVERLGAASVERLVILTTPESEAQHYASLVTSLGALGLPEERISHLRGLDTDQAADKQWGWFSALISSVPQNSSLVFDFTHGFRSVPIVFSAALGFLQRVRGARIQHAFYGWLAHGASVGELVDMADFYRIHDWAAAVSQLVETASAEALLKVSEREPVSGPFSALNDPELISAFRELTGIVKNVDVTEVTRAADKALGIIRRRMNLEDPITHPLLELVLEKFQSLGGASEDLVHSAAWYRVQFSLCRVLLSHGLAMQAYTVMAETIAAFSLGLLPPDSEYARSRGAARRDNRKRFGEVLPRMLNYDRRNWRFTSDFEASTMAHLLPAWDALEAAGLLPSLTRTSREVAGTRNGFAHAWTGSRRASDSDVVARGAELLTELEAFFEAATGAGLLHPLKGPGPGKVALSGKVRSAKAPLNSAKR